MMFRFTVIEVELPKESSTETLPKYDPVARKFMLVAGWIVSPLAMLAFDIDVCPFIKSQLLLLVAVALNVWAPLELERNTN